MIRLQYLNKLQIKNKGYISRNHLL